MYRSILVPLDGSAFSEHALPLALSIARRTGAMVHLVHAHAKTLPMFVDGMPLSDNALDKQERESEQAYLQGLANRLLASWDVPIVGTLLDDPVADALHGYAVEIGADLMVMATHGRSGLSRLWLGSIADELVRRAPIPILLVRPHEEVLDLLELSRHEQAINRILIPLDSSPLAERALAHAIALGAPMQAEYTLLQVIDPMVITYSPTAQATGPDDQRLEQLRTRARDYLERAAAPLIAQSQRVKMEVVYGQPAIAILDYARGHGINVIAMATHGRGGLSRMLLGSVADKVVRGACAPVLLYRPTDEATAPQA